MVRQVDAAAESIASDRITPVFAVSNVSGLGLPLLRAFVARLRRNKARDDDATMQVKNDFRAFPLRCFLVSPITCFFVFQTICTTPKHCPRRNPSSFVRFDEMYKWCAMPVSASNIFSPSTHCTVLGRLGGSTRYTVTARVVSAMFVCSTPYIPSPCSQKIVMETSNVCPYPSFTRSLPDPGVKSAGGPLPHRWRLRGQGSGDCGRGHYASGVGDDKPDAPHWPGSRGRLHSSHGELARRRATAQSLAQHSCLVFVSFCFASCRRVLYTI